MIVNGTDAENLSIGRRIKKIRQELELSQRDFSVGLSLSNSYIAGVETGIRKVNMRLIKLIVSEYGVNEDWLKTGHGEMFIQNTDEKFVKLVSLYKELPSKYQEVVLKIIDILLKLKE